MRMSIQGIFAMVIPVFPASSTNSKMKESPSAPPRTVSSLPLLLVTVIGLVHPVRVAVTCPHTGVFGVYITVQYGGSLSIFETVALVHTLLFPTISEMVTLQVTPLLARVQEPPAVAIQLSPSVLQAKVAVTFPLVGVVGL